MKNKSTESLVVNLLKLAGAIAFIPLFVAWAGWLTGITLSVMWSWFVVPVFGLPALTIAQSFGLSLVAHCFRMKAIRSAQEKEPIWSTVARAIFQPLFLCGVLLSTGWVLNRWFI